MKIILLEETAKMLSYFFEKTTKLDEDETIQTHKATSKCIFQVELMN